jgi:hypothetical protein
MNCQDARATFPELLDPRTPAPAHLEARAHLANCPACQRDFATLAQTLTALDTVPDPQPSPRLRQQFYALLEEEKHSAASARAAVEREQRRRSVLRWIFAPLGGAALLAVGFTFGLRFTPSPPVQTVTVADAETKQELHDLRTKIEHLETMNQLVAASFQSNQRPANDRLRGVLTSAAQENPNDRVINELISSLALDSSANVRMAALDALYPYANRDAVRATVLASLPRETNPMVQVMMIDFLAAARDFEAKPALERMSVNTLADQNVREAAKRALAQL